MKPRLKHPPPAAPLASLVNAVKVAVAKPAEMVAVVVVGEKVVAKPVVASAQNEPSAQSVHNVPNVQKAEIQKGVQSAANVVKAVQNVVAAAAATNAAARPATAPKVAAKHARMKSATATLRKLTPWRRMPTSQHAQREVKAAVVVGDVVIAAPHLVTPTSMMTTCKPWQRRQISLPTWLPLKARRPSQIKKVKA
jgi:hypothetical protein